MDAREMKKVILVNALEHFEEMIEEDSSYYEISIILDGEPGRITPATRRRFLNVLEKMIEDARSKV